MERVHNLEFESGMLTKAVLKKPSEVLAGLDIPLEVTKAILDLPGEVVGRNITKIQNRNLLLDQELMATQKANSLTRGQMDEEIKNINKALELRDAQNKLKQATGSSMTPGAPVNQRTVNP